MDLKLIDALFACRYYSAVTGFDDAIREFQQATVPAPNLAHKAHRSALLKWLNRWGCRHIAKKFHPRASDLICDWWLTFSDQLPPLETCLADLTADQIVAADAAYKDLRSRQIGHLKVKHRTNPVPIPIGETAAAKILFAVRPNAFPPWDAPIRGKLNGSAGSATGYKAYIEASRDVVQALIGEARRRGQDPAKLATLLGRADSSLAKIVDECNWVYMTKGYEKIRADELRRIHEWSKEV